MSLVRLNGGFVKALMAALSPENKAIANILSDAISDYVQSGKLRQLSLQLEEFEGCRFEFSRSVSSSRKQRAFQLERPSRTKSQF